MSNFSLKKVQFRPGQRLFAEGEVGDSFYIIEEGTVEVIMPLLQKATEMQVALLGPGEAVGELSIITKQPRNAMARAVTFVNAIKVSDKDYQMMVGELPGWARAFILSLAKRIQSTDIRLSEAHIKSLRTAVEHARMGKELKIAHVVQNTLFPEADGLYGTLQVAGFYQSASECSGDWWYHNKIGDKVFVWLGDATGHGVSAALVVSAARSVASILEFDKDLTPSKALKILSHSIFQTSRGKVSMTFFVGCYDLNTGVFAYSNASHEPPLMFRLIRDHYFLEQPVFLNKVNNPRLGGGVDHEFKEASIKLEKGDYIIAYTDGLTSLPNPQRLHYGDRRLMNTFYKTIQNFSSASEVVKNLTERMFEFKKTARLDDDVTFFVIHLPL